MEIRLVSEDWALEQCAAMMALSEPWITLKRNLTECRKALEGDFREVHAAIDNQKVVGFVVLQMRGTFAGYLQTICVSPEMRGAGIGKELLRFTENYVFKVSPNLFLCVSSFNSSAIRWYQQSGFQKIGVLPDFIERGFDEILMRKTNASWNEFKNRN